MELLLICGTLLFAFTISVIAVPSVVKVAISKKLFKPSGGRWIHKGIVPPFGGVAILLGFIISSVIFTGNIQFHIYKYIISSVILIFFVGLKDDILNISARNKFLGQISATTILIIFGNLRITNLHGFGGIYNISFTFSFIISLFIILSLINAFNLIDGIDGLASGLGMVASSVLGSWFIAGGHIHYAILSFALAGSLAGFFLYNVFGKKYKLFMGDSGSMMIGLVISVLIIEFNELNLLDTTTSNYIIKSTPSVSFACVICPLIDMLRVMFIRLLYKKSPFSPDNNHIHHKLLKINSNHLYITSIIVTANIILIIIALAMNNAGWDITLQFLLIFALGIIYSFIPSIIKQTEQTKNKHSVLINYRD